MPLSVDDQLAISDAIARYSHALDFGDSEAWVDLYTEDGVFDAGPPFEHRAAGRAELERYAERLQAGDRRRRHWTNNSIIEGDGDQATNTMYLLVFAVDGPPRLMVAGSYADRLVCVAGRWRFAERVVRFAQPAGS